MDKILVTGGSGFIGSHVCEFLLDKGICIICLDNFDNYYNQEIKKKNIEQLISKKNFKLYTEDVRNYDGLEKIFEKDKIDKIIHLAAKVGVRNSFENTGIYFDVNLNGTKNLLDLAVKYHTKNFIFASSSSVYGVNKKSPFSESDEISRQISPYAQTKKYGEELCREYHENFGININCLRFFTVYGPKGRPDMAPYQFVDLISKGEPIKIYSDKEEFNEGKIARDFTFIEDIVNGTSLSLDAFFGFEIFNIGRGQSVKMNDFVETIEDKLNKKSLKKFVGSVKGDVPITYADISKSRKMLNYNPQINISDGIERFVKWYAGEAR